MSDTKRFEDYPKVDCNDCTHYWNESCSGQDALKGSERLCTAFTASRRVDIPLQIKQLREAFKWLTCAVVMLTIGIVIHILGG